MCCADFYSSHVLGTNTFPALEQQQRVEGGERERRRRRFRRFALFGNGSNRWTEHRQRFFKDGFFIFSLLRISYFLLLLLNRCHAMPCHSAWLPWIVIGQYIETIRLTTTTMLLCISYYYRSLPSCMVICNIKYCIRSTHRPI